LQRPSIFEKRGESRFCGANVIGLPFLWFVSLHPKGHKGKQRNEQITRGKKFKKMKY